MVQEWLDKTRKLTEENFYELNPALRLKENETIQITQLKQRKRK
jgi:hypothetical protein